MTHTEKFNRIMEETNSSHKDKAAQKKLIPVKIGERENMNALQASIAKCSIAGNTVFLPDIKEGMLPNYGDVRKAFLNAGAEYKRNTFVFPNDAQPYIDRLMGGESVNIKKEFQFFATPPHLAEEMAAFIMNGFDAEKMTILEPSAGQGALVKACLNFDDRNQMIVHAYELMDINRAVLGKIKDCIVLGDDFLTADVPGNFDRIIANPPFNKNQDIDHIRKMYQVCKKGGRIVTIASKHWQISKNKKETDFREWLEEIGAVIDDIEAGEFSESGTKIATCMIIIDK